MREALLRLLGPESRLQTSTLPGRSGFVLTSNRPLAELRQALMPHWACRLYPLHAASGRHFLEPRPEALARALLRDLPLSWWNPGHQRAASEFFAAARGERVRRLALPGGGQSSSWTRGFLALRDLALRLESLHVTPRPDKHWRGLGESFDQLWSATRLYTIPSDALWLAALGHLQRCRARTGTLSAD